MLQQAHSIGQRTNMRSLMPGSSPKHHQGLMNEKPVPDKLRCVGEQNGEADEILSCQAGLFRCSLSGSSGALRPEQRALSSVEVAEFGRFDF